MGLFFIALYSFYPTYEELKAALSSWAGIFAPGFYPTYEELKENRNYREKGAEDPFLPYLWGIESIFSWYARQSV